MSANTDDGASRYDLLLAAVPLLLVAGIALAVPLATSHDLYLGLATGSVTASVAVGYGLFADPPTSEV